jgi:hypothetical protein
MENFIAANRAADRADRLEVCVRRVQGDSRNYSRYRALADAQSRAEVVEIRRTAAGLREHPELEG